MTNGNGAACGLANGSDAHLRGQGPRGYGRAAHGLPACESRDAGRAPPSGFDSNEAARLPGRSRAASGAAASWAAPLSLYG